MKTLKALTLVLALTLIMAPLTATRLMAAPSGPINYVVKFSTPLTAPMSLNPDGSLYIPDTTALNTQFTVEIHLVGATVGNAPTGIGGIEDHLNFVPLMTYAIVTGYTDNTGQVGGVLNAPTLEPPGFTGGIYNSTGSLLAPANYANAAQYIVVAAGTGAWNGADGLVATITFKLTSIPEAPIVVGNATCNLVQTFTDLTDPGSTVIPHGSIDNYVSLQASAYLAKASPYITITPSSQQGPPAIGAPIMYTVNLQSDPFWDVAGYDVNITWNPALLTFVSYTDGPFLNGTGMTDTDFTFNITYGTPISAVEVVGVKTSNNTPSGSLTDTPLALFTLHFVTANFTTGPPLTTPVAFVFTDLVSFAHPELPVPPWNGSSLAAEMPYKAGPRDSLGDGMHERGPNAQYIEGQQVLGAAIDSFDNYPDGYNGKGPNVPSDSISPQQNVTLYANVTYNGGPVANKLVAFQINNPLGQKVTILQATTNGSGIATVSFRVPQTGNGVQQNNSYYDPSIFGWWTEIETVEIDGKIVNDTMPFLVGWLYQVTWVTQPADTPIGGTIQFAVSLLSISEQPRNVTVSIDIYDCEGYPIGELKWNVTNGYPAQINATGYVIPTFYTWGASPNLTLPSYLTGETTAQVVVNPANLTLVIPMWARVGPGATIIGYALTAMPIDGGVPYGPQSNCDGSTTTFAILL